MPRLAWLLSVSPPTACLGLREHQVLERVVMVSRHGVRAPMRPISTLESLDAAQLARNGLCLPVK